MFDTNTERKKNCSGDCQNRNKYLPVGDADAYNYKLQEAPGMFFLFHKETVREAKLLPRHWFFNLLIKALGFTLVQSIQAILF